VRCGCIGDDAGEEKEDDDGEEKDDDFRIFVRRERESAGSAESSASPSSVPSSVPSPVRPFSIIIIRWVMLEEGGGSP